MDKHRPVEKFLDRKASHTFRLVTILTESTENAGAILVIVLFDSDTKSSTVYRLVLFSGTMNLGGVKQLHHETYMSSNCTTPIPRDRSDISVL